jgi:pimeloyl-ACP methyl ester carboxylesterase
MASAAQPCQISGGQGSCLERLPLGDGAALPIYRSYALDHAAAVTTAVIVVHGTGRNADDYYDSIAQNADAQTEVIAPWFQTDDDDPRSGDAYWANGGDTSWKDGGDALYPDGLSSFAAMDRLLAVLNDKQEFPHLTRITIVGHSAGGQFVQRYAAGGEVPAATPTRFVVANPSSYLYLSPERPDSTDGCSGYNDYKYGLDHLNDYMAAGGPDMIKQRYTSRPVTYLLGEDDIYQNHSIDDSCEAQAQGENRLARGENYAAMIASQYPSAPHAQVLGPGVGHDYEKMFDSDQGKAVIFG